MIAAITTCPTGIAHTYMAADALASADVVIFATDIGVRDRERFKGKRLLKCSPRQAIRDPNDTLSAALALINTPVNTAAQPQTTHRVSDTAYDLERKNAPRCNDRCFLHGYVCGSRRISLGPWISLRRLRHSYRVAGNSRPAFAHRSAQPRCDHRYGYRVIPLFPTF